jgi:23S rRNA pseudouridine2605 synthase
VVKIIRVRIGSLRLGSLKPREWRRLTDDEVAELKGKPVQKPKPSGGKPFADAKKPWKKPASSKGLPASRHNPPGKQPYTPKTAPKPGSGKSRQHKG